MNGASSNRTAAARTARLILTVSALLLPSLSLVPLGGLYLWEKGWLIWWAMAALVTIAAVAGLQRRLLGGAPVPAATPPKPFPDGELPSPAEKSAWLAVAHISDNVDIEKLEDAEAVLDLGHRVVNAVARRMHPQKSDALWRFTLPEAMAIIERVSSRMGRAVVQTVPFGDRLTVSQFLTIYRWRHLAESAERAYDVWRLVRLANPATAATHELRERLSRALLDKGREHITRRLAQAYVEEVGRAAIDLYGGRLRVAQGAGAARQGAERQPVAGAISVLVAGARTDVNQRVARHLAEHERGCASATLAATRLKDIAMGRGSLIAAGFVVSEAGDEPATADAIVAREARGTDMIVWVLGSDPAEIAFAGAALLAVADDFRAAPDLLPPPLVVVCDGSAAELIQEALQELVRIYPAASAAPAAIPGLESGSIEIGPVWQAVLDQAPVALRVQALRRLAALKQGDGWFASARQAIGAGGRMAQWLAGRWPSGKQS
jgi:hypothetical protein